MSEANNTNKHIEQLNAIINYEVEKPYKEMDADLVEVCVELIFELQGKNFTLSDEKLEEKVRKIPFVDIADVKAIQQKKRKKIKTRKILLIAAIIAILLAVLAVFSTGRYIEDIHRFMKDTFGSVFDAPIGEIFYNDNNEDLNNGIVVVYENIDEFCEKENIAVLCPTELPSGIEFVNIRISHSDRAIIIYYNKEITSYEIYLDKAIPQVVKDTAESYYTDNNLTCYIERMEDIGIVQIYFEHNGNYYMVGGANEQILLNIIENLEEYK